MPPLHPGAQRQQSEFGRRPRENASHGNLPHAVDYRSVYATVLERWWSLPSRPVLDGRFETLGILG